MLRERLVASGDLDPVAGSGPVFILSVEAAVKRFQARNGLSQTGAVNEATFTELNEPAAARLQQLQTNIVRLKAYSGDLGARYVVANIPAASVETVEGGVVYSHHAAGVGKIDRQSPIMQTKATEINFNPFWTVPPSLIKKDLIPKMKADPNYLADEKIRVFNKDGQEVSPASIDWNSNEATNFKYRQDTGADLNSLGFVRINISNPYGVYMHDTPSKGILGDDLPLRVFRLHPGGGCARLCRLAVEGHTRLGSGPDRRGHPLRRPPRRQARAAGQRLLDLRYGLGDAGRHRSVPARCLPAGWGGPRALASAVPTQPMALPQE